jgi:hypothetical protein
MDIGYIQTAGIIATMLVLSYLVYLLKVELARGLLMLRDIVRALERNSKRIDKLEDREP